MTPATDYAAYEGLAAPTRTSLSPLDDESIRRFVQAIMDDDPVHHDRDVAAASRYGALVAPPLYPVHAFRRANGTPDPLDGLLHDRDADGAGNAIAGLPPIPSPYKRLLNGGNEIEFFRCLKAGERVVANARYARIAEKEGRSGKLLTVVIETVYETADGEPLLTNRQTLIWR